MIGGPSPPADDDADDDGAGFVPVPLLVFLLLEQAAITMIAAVAAAAAMSGLRRFIWISIPLWIPRQPWRQGLITVAERVYWSVAARTGVEGVAHRVAEEVECEH